VKKLLLLLFLAACTGGGRVTTMEAFYSVDFSSTEQEVVAALGKPYAIVRLEDGSVEFEYIERIKVGSQTAESRRYFIVLKDGIVVSKRVKQASYPAYWYDSYDMQTTQNSE
jgi:hypothetical protein